MAHFTLSTLQLGDGELEAAITINDNHYLLSKLNTSGLRDKVTVKQLLEDWASTEATLQGIADQIHNDPDAFLSAIASNVTIDTPIRFPNKLLAVGANYAGHLREMGLPAEKWNPMPFFTCPPSTSMVGPGKTVKFPYGTSEFDWECELVIVLGRKLRHASVEQAREAIAGYTIGLDLSCRDLMAPGQGGLIDLVRGKAQETMKPCGPAFVPQKFIADDGNLAVKLSVNGELMIDDNSADMIWRPEECLAEISKVLTLEPGDMVLTGSPAGSAGVHGGRWLKVGDRISAEIEGVGEMNVEVIE